jgi:pyruvate formate lyase activating enzyme
MARETAFSAGLHFPYIGNVPGHEGENTYCFSCKKVVIRRIGFEVVENSLEKGTCKFCHQPIAGVWGKKQIRL